MVLKNKKIEINSHLLNENIPFSRVLLINGEKKEIITRQQALEEAKKADLDLFCVAPEVTPPVCKLINYQKYLFELSKKKKTEKKNTCKEISVSFNIEENDLRVKLGKVNQWVEGGSTVKISLIMSGKEKTHPELAYEKCQKIIADLQSQLPKIELRDNIRKHLGSFYFFLYKKKQ
jgi:translation initiation factor IF-3